MKLASLCAGVALCATARAELLPVTETTLANGLRVILAPDPSVSSVIVDVRYATSEPALAHVIERLMFAGSTHVSDFEAQIDATGGWSSSVATSEHISVFEQAPAGALALVLWLEAERMAGVPEVIDEPRVRHARAAISAERRAAYEDHPSALVSRAVGVTLSAFDPLAVAPGDGTGIPAFARTLLSPTNATLVIAGRFALADAAALVRRDFAWIPGTPVAQVGRADSPLAAAIELTVEDPIAKVVVAARIGAPYSAEAIDLEIAAQLLAGGPTSRLWRGLVDAALATEVHTEIIRQTGELRIQATPRGNVDPSRLATEIHEQLARLVEREPSQDEVTRAQLAIQSELVTGLEGLAFRAETLAAWSAYTGHANQLEATRAMLRAATPQSVRRSAQRWLGRTVTVIGRPR